MNETDQQILDLIPEDDSTPWWRRLADAEIPADPPAEKRRCFTPEDKAKSPYYPEVDPPALPPEARAAGVERADLVPTDADEAGRE